MNKLNKQMFIRKLVFLVVVLLVLGVIPGADQPILLGASLRGLIGLVLGAELVSGVFNWCADLCDEQGLAAVAKTANKKAQVSQTWRLLARTFVWAFSHAKKQVKVEAVEAKS